MITVLIVEDSICDLEYCRRALETLPDVKTLSVTSGEAALAVLNQQRIDIFCLDVDLPGMGGFDLAQRLRSMEGYSQAYIIFITGQNRDQLEVFRTLHCYDYITKPFSLKEFKDRIADLLLTIKREQRAKEKNGERRSAVLLELPDRMLAVARESILYAEVMKNDCKLVTYEACGEREYTLLRFPLKDLIEQVDDPHLIRCHKSYAVNVRQIQSLKGMDYRSGQICFYVSDNVIDFSGKYKSELERLFVSLHRIPSLDGIAEGTEL